jgi:hypothetical protein
MLEMKITMDQIHSTVVSIISRLDKIDKRTLEIGAKIVGC